jgi:hypothetical protein
MSWTNCKGASEKGVNGDEGWWWDGIGIGRDEEGWCEWGGSGSVNQFDM